MIIMPKWYRSSDFYFNSQEMALTDETFSSQQLFNSRNHVWNQIFSFINSMSLKCAMELGIFDVIHKHGKPITLSELIHALPINKQKSHCVDRLMRMLIHSNFSVKVSISDKDDENEGYWLTPASRLLVKEDPMSLEPFVVAVLDPLLIDPFHQLGEWFKNDTPTPCASAHGMPFWELAGKDTRLNRFFNEAMASDSRFVANVVSRDYKHVFEGLKSLVDVGGGIGTMAKCISHAFPGLKCIVLDLPHVVAGLEGTDNLAFIGGDMFDFVPPADAVFFKWMLHTWSDDDCVIILKKCKEAISNRENGGKVIMIEMVVDDTKEHEEAETQFFFDILLMTLVTGKERTEKQWKQLFTNAGFTSYKITPGLGLRSIIEIFP